MNKTAYSWSRIIRGAAIALGILWSQSGFAGIVIIDMPSDPGQWLAYVDIGTGTGGTWDQSYLGGISTFGVSFPPDGAGHPAVPGGYPINMAAFVDPTTGQLGVAGSNAFTGITSGLARFEMNLQFANSGTITPVVHFQGTVSAAGPDSLLNPTFGYLGEYVQLNDLTGGVGSHSNIQGYSICTPLARSYSCASVQPSISTDLQFDFEVQANHVYQLLVDTEGVAIGAAAFDGIDPSSISLRLSPGLSFTAANGIALPGFLGASPPPSGGVPEPTTLPLMSLGLAGMMLARRRKARTHSF